MIKDCCFPEIKLYDFLVDNDTAFTRPLSKSLAERGITLHEYARKLSALGTISYEQDEIGVMKGIVVGYTRNLSEDGGSYITQVVTGVDYRNQGVCNRLLREYIDFCATKNISFVWLTTGVDNKAAQHTYEKAGFGLVESDQPHLVKYVYHLG